MEVVAMDGRRIAALRIHRAGAKPTSAATGVGTGVAAHSA